MAKQRVEYQDMIDLDGYIKRVADARGDYKAFVDDVLRLNDLMQKSSLSVRTEIENIRRSNASTDDGKAQEAFAQRVAGLTTQYRDQKAAVDALNKVNGQLNTVTNTLLSRQEQLIQQYASVQGSTQKDINLKNRLAKEMVNLQNQFDRLDSSTRKNLGQTKEVIGQYNLLQKELADARKELKSLDDAFDENTGKINKNNAAAVTLSQRISTADGALKKMDAGMGVYNRNVGNYQSALEGLVSGGFSGLLTSLGLVGVAFAKVIDIGGEAIDKMSLYAQNRNGLKAVSDDAKDLIHTEEELEQLADRLGLSYLKLSESYKGIKTGTKDTALEGMEAERIFRAFTTRLAELQAPADKSERALEALSQMISKGNVQAEELRGQLGDAMPGAFKLFADALGVSTVELNKMLDKGEVLAVDVLPKVADELERTYSGTAADNINEMTGATARLENQTGLLLDTFNQTTGITRFFASIKNGIADTLASMRLALKSGDWLAFFAAISPTQAGGLVRGQLQIAVDQQKRVDEFKAMSAKLRQARLQMLQEEAATYKDQYDNLGGGQDALNNYRKTMDELLRLQRANLQVSAQERKQARIDEANSDKKYHEERVAAVAKEAKDMTLAQRNARIGQYQQQIASDQAKLKENPDLANSLNRDIAYAKEFIKAIQDVNKELDKKDKKQSERDAKSDARAAKAAQQKAQQEAKTLLSDSLNTASSNTSAQLATNVSNKENGTIDEKQFIIDRYNITIAGITQRRALLNKAHNDEIIDQKEFDKQIAQLNEETAKAGADYLNGKVDLQEKAFKQALDATKNAISLDNKDVEANLKQRLSDIATAADQQELVIKQQVAARKITEDEAEDQIHSLRLQHIDDILNATLAAADTEEQLAKNRVATLKASGASATQIAEAVAVEAKAIDDAENKRKDASAQRDKDRSEDVKKKQIQDAEEVARVNKEIDQQKWQIASTAVAGFFELSDAFRQQDLDRLDKQKDAELATVGDNANAKANIEQKYAAKSAALKRKQAVADKAAALFQIAISTAEGAINAASKVVTLPLVPFIIALGAIQAGIVAAKPIPEYWKGISDAPEGPAWVGERGFELIESKKGGKPYYRIAAQKQLAYLNAHDRVYTHQETKRIIQTNQEIANEVRMAPGGSQYVPPVVQAGLSKSDMAEVMEQAFAEQVVYQTTITNGELKLLIKKKQQLTDWKNGYFSLPKK